MCVTATQQDNNSKVMFFLWHFMAVIRVYHTIAHVFVRTIIDTIHSTGPNFNPHN